MCHLQEIPVVVCVFANVPNNQITFKTQCSHSYYNVSLDILVAIFT